MFLCKIKGHKGTFTACNDTKTIGDKKYRDVLINGSWQTVNESKVIKEEL